MNFIKKQENKDIESTRGYHYKTPLTDIIEYDGYYKMIFDLPGIEKKDISLKVEKDILTITAECDKSPAKDYNCIREEHTYAGYMRSFNLNNIIDDKNIQAEYKDGTLILTLPKKEEQKAKEIEIKVG